MHTIRPRPMSQFTTADLVGCPNSRTLKTNTELQTELNLQPERGAE